MSDEATTTAAPDSGPAPSAAPEAAPSEAPQRAPEAPEGAPAPQGGEGERARPEPARTAREARQRIKDRARGRQTAAPEGETGGKEESVAERINRGDPGLPRDGEGKWRSPNHEAAAREKAQEKSETGPPDGAPSDATRADGAPPPEAGTGPEAPPSGAPEGMVRIPVPEGHPLAHKGVTHIDFPADQEQYGRWSVNQGMRVQELEAQKQRYVEAVEHAEATRAEAEFWRANAGEYFGPEFYQTYNDLKETYGEQRAEEFKAGVMHRAQSKIQEAQQQARMKVRDRQVLDQAHEIRNRVHDLAPKVFPHWDTADVDRALADFGQEMTRRGIREFNPREFKTFANQRYLQHPAMQQQIQQDAVKRKEQMRQEAMREAEEALRAREQERLREAAQGRRRNPLQRVPHTETGRQSEGSEPNRPQSAREMRQRVKERARGQRR